MRCISYRALKLFSLSSILALAACNAEDAGSLFDFVSDDNPAPVVDPEPDPATLEQVQEFVFDQNCAGCHGGDEPSAGLSLDSVENSYAGLLNIASGSSTLVIPNDPDNSYLVNKMEGEANISGQIMPPSGVLPSDTIDIVRGWIADGAQPAASSDPEPATLEEVQAQVFSVSCAGCHSADDPDGGLALDSAENSHAGLVNVASGAASAFTRVIPGDPDNSYLINKMQEAANIVGQVMPPSGALPSESIDLVRGWIFAGAEPAAAVEPSVTFTQIQEQIFAVYCAGCHSSQSAMGSLVLDSETTSYAELVGQASLQQGELLLVNPGNPDDSYLVRKIEGDPSITQDPMPPSGILSAEALQMVRTWISEGALQSAAVATQSRVIKTQVNENSGSVVYRLQLSAFVDSSSVSDGVVQLYVIEGETRYLANPEDVNVTVMGPELVVTYDSRDVVFDSLELELNNPNIASMLDTFGATVENGTYEYFSVSQ